MSKTLLSLCLALLPLPLLAAPEQDDFLSGELELTVARNFSSKSFFKRVESSFTTNLPAPWNAQMDIGVSKYEADNSTSPFLAIHIVYNLNDSTDLGMFLSGEDRMGTSYSLWGIEAAHDAGPFHIEGFAGVHEPVTAGLRGSYYGLETAWGFGAEQQWQALAGGYYADFDGGSSANSAYLGLARHMPHNITLEARAARHDGADNVLSVSARFGLGHGAYFNRRDWYQAFPVY
jgi:hypothetical protein